MIPLIDLGKPKWDKALLYDALLCKLADGGHLIGKYPVMDGAVVVASVGEHEGDRSFEEVQVTIATLEWVVLCLVSDEAGSFPWRDLQHPNMRIWVQTPTPEGHHGHDRFLLVGYPPDTPALIAGGPDPSVDRRHQWVFEGQVNHARRRTMFRRLHRRQDGKLLETEGFTLGRLRPEFLLDLVGSKIAPCPSGPVTPDTFRMAEALEAGCVPIIDAECPAGHNGFWPLVLGHDHPLPIAEDWGNVGDMIDGQLHLWPANATRCSAWWQKYKHAFQRRLHDDITELSGQHEGDWPIRTTILIPTSPIPSHPSTEIIEQTVASVRHCCLLYTSPSPRDS